MVTVSVLKRGDVMLMRQVDLKAMAVRPISISYLIQTANQFDCDIYVMSGSKESANVKNYDEVKKFKMNISPLFFYFKGSDEGAARDRIGSLFTLG